MTQFDCPNCGAQLKVTSHRSQETNAMTTQSIRNLFPKEVARMLDFEKAKGYTIIKAHKFLGAQTFSKIAAIVSNAGGEYISAGKDSHFRIPTKKDS